MRVTGYRLKGYDATYEKTMFDIIERDCVLEITEINSGTTFIIDKGEENDRQTRKKKNV